MARAPAIKRKNHAFAIEKHRHAFASSRELNTVFDRSRGLLKYAGHGKRSRPLDRGERCFFTSM
ncbi:MAG: hypothetical protein ACRD5Z_23710 [Bryobacteraceae bacterium]